MKVFCCLLLLLNGAQCWWIFSSTETEQPAVTAVKETARPVAFEIDTAEHKFLAEAQQFLDIPQLDQCQHKVLVLLQCVCVCVCTCGTQLDQCQHKVLVLLQCVCVCGIKWHERHLLDNQGPLMHGRGSRQGRWVRARS